MTYLEAAYQVLKQTGEPLHYKEITARALAQGLIQPTGLTPEATMGSRLYTDTKQEGSRFVRAGRGVFDLAERQPAGIDRRVQAINRATRDQLRDLLHTMPPDRFEALIGELLIQMGFDESTVQVTQRSNDGGIDVVGVFRAAGLTEMNVAVQVKRLGVVEKTLKVIGLDDEWWGEMFATEVTPQSKPLSEPHPTTASHRKPTRIVLFGEEHPVRTWKDALLKTIEVLLERHPDDFTAKATTLHGRKRQYIAPTPVGMIAPHAIPNTDLWVETNLSAKSIQKLSRTLLEIFGYPPGELVIQIT